MKTRNTRKRRFSRPSKTKAWGVLTVLAVVGLITTVEASSQGNTRTGSGGAPTRPNIVVFRTDDQDQYSMSARLPNGNYVLPNIRRLIGSQGVTFRNSFVTCSLCSPSRASFLTGQDVHNHHVYTNDPPVGGYPALDQSRTLPVWLQHAGYQTIYVGGKYMNAYDTSSPLGWNQWNIQTPTYYGYNMYETGGVIETFGDGVADYSTDVTTRKALEFINSNRDDSKPFFLLVDYFAPHKNSGGVLCPPGETCPNPIPSQQYMGSLSQYTPYFPPSLNEADVSDKPSFISTLPLLTQDQIRDLVGFYRDTLEALRSVDDGVGRIMSALKSTGSLDNTYVFYTSDNGFTFGEHRNFKGKDDQYRESINVPLLITGPGVLKNVVREDVVANIDLAPTIEALTGAQPTLVQDGRSLVPLMTNASASWDRDLLLENYSNQSAVTERSVYSGVRNRGYRYTEYDYDYDGLIDDMELYRFVPDQCGSTTDFFELENQRHNACYVPLIRQLHARLQQLKTGL